MSAHATSLFDIAGFQTRLSEQMALAGLNWRQTSHRAGLGESAVRDLMNGNSADPRIGTVLRLAKALNSTPESLLGFPQSKVELSLEHAAILLAIGRDYRLICKLVETDCTTEQEEALGELKDECASLRKWRIRAKA